jgi:GntR family transcriptional regulator, transcriptional repressor for pyruvate dehydrogenase complex
MEDIHIKQVKRGRLSDQVVSQLRELIHSGELKAGERLPGEYKLAEMFKVSRTSIRDALRTLETIGIIEIISGSGTYVTDLSERLNTPQESLKWLIERKDMVVEIQEVREVVQGLAARLCAKRINADQLEILREAARELGQAEKHPEEFEKLIKTNTNFHYLIGEYSGNSLLSELVLHFENLYSAGSEAIIKQDGRTEIYFTEHNGVFGAIEAGDGELAEKRMCDHISHTRSDIASLEMNDS